MSKFDKLMCIATSRKTLVQSTRRSC